MKANEYVIVIGRQFGSGGRAVGQALAKKLAIPYYDKELLRLSARSVGFSEEIFDQADESRPTLFSSLLSMGFGTADGNYSPSSLSHEGLYAAQSKVLTQVASQGPCVIVGRTADYVLRELPNMTSIFLHAPLDFRARNIVRRGECDTLDQGVQLARKRDRMRENYYNFFTGRHWGRADNYHLSLDASLGDPSTVADMISIWLDSRDRTRIVH